MPQSPGLALPRGQHAALAPPRPRAPAGPTAAGVGQAGQGPQRETLQLLLPHAAQPLLLPAPQPVQGTGAVQAVPRQHSEEGTRGSGRASAGPRGGGAVRQQRGRPEGKGRGCRRPCHPCHLLVRGLERQCRKSEGGAAQGDRPGDLEGRTLPPECPRGLLSTEQHVSRARAAGSPGPLNHTRNWSSRPAAQPTPPRPRPAAPSRVGPQRCLGGGSQVRGDPVRLPDKRSPRPPLVLHGPVTQCHSHAHTGSHTHTPTRARTLTRSHAHTGSHARCSQAHTHVARAPRAPHSQLLQGEALDGFPGQRLQGVGGQVPAGAGQQTDPVSDPL